MSHVLAYNASTIGSCLLDDRLCAQSASRYFEATTYPGSSNVNSSNGKSIFTGYLRSLIAHLIHCPNMLQRPFLPPEIAAFCCLLLLCLSQFKWIDISQELTSKFPLTTQTTQSKTALFTPLRIVESCDAKELRRRIESDLELGNFKCGNCIHTLSRQLRIWHCTDAASSTAVMCLVMR